MVDWQVFVRQLPGFVDIMAGESGLEDADASGGLGTDYSQGTAYTPIKVLGRGAFGEAVLYRREEVRAF